MVSFDVIIELFPSNPLIIYKPSFKSPTEKLIEFWLSGSFIYLINLPGRNVFTGFSGL